MNMNGCDRMKEVPIIMSYALQDLLIREVR